MVGPRSRRPDGVTAEMRGVVDRQKRSFSGESESAVSELIDYEEIR